MTDSVRVTLTGTVVGASPNDTDSVMAAIAAALTDSPTVAWTSMDIAFDPPVVVRIDAKTRPEP